MSIGESGGIIDKLGPIILQVLRKCDTFFMEIIMNRLGLIVTAFLIVFSAGSEVLAESIPQEEIKALKKENELLKQRTEKLEQEMAELKRMIAEQSKAIGPAVEPSKVETPPTKQPSQVRLTEEDYQKLIELAEKSEDKKPLWSSLDVQFYGYIKGDASYDDSRVTTGNYMLWVDNEAATRDDDEFNLTANQTRLGFKVAGPEDGGMKSSGQVEIDFYGNGSGENKAGILLRHAFMDLEWPEQQFSLLFGQTSDVFSPLVPSTLNYTVLWDAGNIGYRHPQIRLTKNLQLSENLDMKLQGAVSRTIGDDELLSVSGAKSGEDSGFPTLQGRVGFTFPSFGYKPTTIGFSGHWGQEEYDKLATTASAEEFDSWSLNIDVTQPINKLLTIKGEAFTGENLNDYFGGIGQGVRSTTAGGITMYHNEIGSKGGWIQASLTPEGKWNYNFGFGMEDVESGDLNYGQRSMNRSIYANAIYSINQNMQVGFELSHWRTEYEGSGDAEDIRAQTSFIYKF